MSTIITKRQFPNYHKYTMELAGRPLTLEVGKLAELANAAVMVTYGETSVLCCVTAAAPDGSQVSFPADTVVMAAGMRPDQDEVDRLMALVPESYVVGDAFRARQIGQATRDAVNAVVDLGL